MSNKMLIERLRTMCADIRRKPIALEHLIPLMQEAATEMERLRAEVEALKLKRTAAELVHRETATTVLMQMAEVQRLRDALKPFAAIDLTTNQAVDPMDVLRARRALEGK